MLNKFKIKLLKFPLKPAVLWGIFVHFLGESGLAAFKKLINPTSLKWKLLIMLPMGIILLTQSYSHALDYLDGREMRWYQYLSSGMVLDACGREYIHPVNPDPELSQFLNKKSDTFSCSSLKNTYIETTSGWELFEFTQQYLSKLVSNYWQITGNISWSGLTPLFSGYYALTIFLIFLLLSLLFSPWLSFVAVYITFPAHNVALSTLHYFRDFSKAPFTVIILGLIIWFLLKKKPTRLFFLSISLGIGVVVGIATGFRTDPIVLLPLFVFILILTPFYFTQGWKKDLGVKILCVFVLMGGLLLSKPTLPENFNFHSTMHVVSLGLMTQFTNNLHLKEDGYSLGKVYQDGFMYRLTRFYEKWKDKPEKPFEFVVSSGHSRASLNYYLDVIRHFPADFWNRITSAVLMTGSRKPLSLYLHFLLFFMILYRFNKRIFWVVLFGWAYLYGLHSVQYSSRHYFHVLFLNLLPPLLFLQLFLNFILKDPWRTFTRWKGELRKANLIKNISTSNSIKGGLLFSFVLLLALGVIPWLLEGYQNQHLKIIYKKDFLEAKKHPVPYELKGKGDDLYELTLSKNAPELKKGMYLALQNNCLNQNYRYKILDEGNRRQRPINQEMTQNNPWHFIPMYSTNLLIVLHKTIKNCIKPYLISEGKRDLYVPVFWNVPSPEVDQVYYLGNQKNIFSRVYPDYTFQFHKHLPNPKNLSWNPNPKTRKVNIDWGYKKYFVAHSPGIEIQGVPTSPFEYILVNQPLKLETPGVLAVSGTLNWGQLNIGLIKNGQWETVANVTEKGNFQVLLPVEKEVHYALVLSNLQSGKIGVKMSVSEVLFTPKNP